MMNTDDTSVETGRPARHNILVLVHYHKRNTSIQKRVNWLKVKVTMTHKRSIFASAVSLNICND